MSTSMMIKSLRFCASVALVGVLAGHASAVVLFSDNFNIDSSPSWTKNAAPAANAGTQTAEFAFNYSSYGIPAAPGSADQIGLRLRANVPIVGGNEVTTRPAGVLSGLSMSPTGQSFGTNYKMTVYAWSNYFGAPNAQGLADNTNSEGGTANVLFAAGTSGTVPLAAGNPNAIASANMDGIAFATTGDGGIVNDYRVFPKAATAVPGTTANVYAAAPAGSATATSNADAFYTAKFLSTTAPVEQQALATAEYGADAFNPMLGNTQAGSFGFAWHKVVVTKLGNIVSWDIDDNRIAQYDASALTLGGSNIAIGVSDVNTSTARHPSLVFTLFDNLQVEDVVAAGVAGDYNNNGKVDAADYVLWRNGGPLQNEVNTPGTVDPTDYDAWKARFGNTSGAGSLSGSSSVPEPTSLLLVVFSAGGYCCLPKRKRS